MLTSSIFFVTIEKSASIEYMTNDKPMIALQREAGMVLVVFPRVGIKFENSPSQGVASGEV